jgi:hypothetical protein
MCGYPTKVHVNRRQGWLTQRKSVRTFYAAV